MVLEKCTRCKWPMTGLDPQSSASSCFDPCIVFLRYEPRCCWSHCRLMPHVIVFHWTSREGGLICCEKITFQSHSVFIPPSRLAGGSSFDRNFWANRPTLNSLRVDIPTPKMLRKFHGPSHLFCSHRFCGNCRRGFETENGPKQPD